MTGSISQLERLAGKKEVGDGDGLGEEQGKESRTSCVFSGLNSNHWQIDNRY